MGSLGRAQGPGAQEIGARLVDDPQPDPAGLQSRPVDLPGRRATTTSPPRPSNGIPASRSTIRRDLVNWRLVKRPLDRASQLDMRGNPDSGGVWAPCLSHADGLFWLVYTDVKRLDGNFKDAHNYIVTAPAIEGPWSDPVYVNSSRLRSVAVPRRRRPQMVPQHAVEPRLARRRRQSEASRPSPASCCRNTTPAAGKLVGPVKNIFAGSATWPGRGPASLQAQRLVLSDDRRGRHRLRSCRDHGARRAPSTAPTSCIPTSI